MKIKRVYLEITNACNLNCPFCTNKKGHDFIDIDDIKKYLSQIKEVSDFIYLHVLGEPLLHPNINNIFAECDKLNLNVQLVTNGTLLKQHLNILNHKSLRKLSISLHSINNIKDNSEYFETINKIIEYKTNSYIELRFYDYKNLDINLKNFHNELLNKYNAVATPKENSIKIKDNVYIYYSKIFEWPSIDDDYLGESGKCHGAIDQIAILHNGEVTICCLDPNGYNSIGNIKEESLSTVLDSSKYKEIINNFRNNKLTFDLCKKCSYRLRFDDKHNSKL